MTIACLTFISAQGGKEFITDLTDYSYDGNSFRSDEKRQFRGISAGDSNSYEDIGSDSLGKWSQATYYGLLCDDLNVKKAIVVPYDGDYSSAIWAAAAAEAAGSDGCIFLASHTVRCCK